MKRLTKDDWHTVRIALDYAIVERESYADATANSRDDQDTNARALALVARFEALHVKMFGEPSAHAAEKAKYAAMPTVSMFDLMGTKAKVPTP